MADTNKTLNTRIILRNDTSANWASANPVLLKGEVAISIDLNRVKIGDGTKTWSQLDYLDASILDKLNELGDLANLDEVSESELETELAAKINKKIDNDVIAASNKLGLVKSSSSQNEVAVDQTTGVMSVNTISSDKIDGSVAEADTLSTERTISVSGDATGSATFDGSADANIAVTLKNSGVTAGTYTKVTVDGKGIVTEGANITTDDVGGAGDIITHSVSEFATSAQGTKADSAVQSVKLGDTEKDSTDVVFTKAEIKSELSFIEATDDITFTQAVKSVATTEESGNTVLTTKGYVDDQINTKIAASNAMVYKGTVGTDGTIETLPSTDVVNGDTYKVVADGTYAGQQAFTGDLFIAVVVDGNVSWTLIPSGDDGNVSTAGTLTSGSVVIGKGNKEVETLTNGSAKQILRVNNDGDAVEWTDETSYTVTSDDDSINVNTTTNGSEKTIDVAVKSVSTDLLTQGALTLILDGGNAATGV